MATWAGIDLTEQINMNLINATNMQAGYTMGMKPDGRELLVVAAKGTFTIPKEGEQVKLAEQQVPLEANVFSIKLWCTFKLYQ